MNPGSVKLHRGLPHLVRLLGILVDPTTFSAETMAPRVSLNSLLARSAARGSCVTITMVRPSAFNSSRKRMTCWLVSGSRFPVGSSARTTPDQ